MWFAGRLSEREISFSALSISDETDDGRFDADFYYRHIICIPVFLFTVLVSNERAGRGSWETIA